MDTILYDLRFLKLLLKNIFSPDDLRQPLMPLDAVKIAFIKSVFTHRVNLTGNNRVVRINRFDLTVYQVREYFRVHNVI